MSLISVLRELQRRGIRIWSEGDGLRWDAPRGTLDDELRAVISAHRAELLRLLDRRPTSDEPAMVVIDRDGSLPLSPGQERLWALEMFEPGRSAYHVPATVRVRGPLDRVALERSLNALMYRHEALRTSFPAIDGQPSMRISDKANMPLRVEHLEVGSISARIDEIRQRASTETTQPFDIANGPLARCVLYRLDDDDHVLHVTMHHLVSDGWSMGVFFREFAVLYDAFRDGQSSPLPDLPVQFVDYAHWQRTRQPQLSGSIDYWIHRLEGAGELQLVTDRPMPAEPSRAGGEVRFEIDTRLGDAIARLARRHQATPFMVMLGAYQLLLSRYAAQDDFVVGTPISGRNRRDIEGVIGFFVNVLAIRAHCDGKLSFNGLLRQVRDDALDALTHQEVPFQRLVEKLRPQRITTYHPIFRVLFNHFNFGRLYDIESRSLRLKPMHNLTTTAKFDLTLHWYEKGGDQTGRLEYSADLFDTETIRRLGRCYVTLLESIVADPERSLTRLSILPEAERRLVSINWSGANNAHSPDDDTIHGRFERLVRGAPDAPAVAYEGQTLTRRALDERANRLARVLLAHGVGRDDRVAVCVEPSLEMIVALLGVLKAGAAYVPIEPAYPRERKRFMMEESEAAVLLTQAHLEGHCPSGRATVLLLDRPFPDVDDRQPLPLVPPERLAYVAYTSGSTGTPRGVEVEHRHLIAYVTGVVPILDLEPGASFASPSTVASDLGNTAIYGALLGGGILHVIAQSRVRDGDAFGAYMQAETIDCLKIMPSHLEALLGAASRHAEVLPRRLLVLGGEACSWELWERIKTAAPGCKVLNHYGPTETTVGVLTHGILLDDRPRYPFRPPLGRALPGTRTYIVDREGEPVPAGVPGELWIGGVQVARGYRGAPALTAKQYRPDPFDDRLGARVYCTGDLVRFCVDGAIQFLGRLDDQVKVRGYRVEPMEIKARLEHLDEVDTCAVVTAPDERHGGLRLIAYVVPRAGRAVEPNALRDELKLHLPDYMIPAAFVGLSALPLMPNGKLDRKALPAPLFSAVGTSTTQTAPPRTDVERTLTAIWCDVLGIDEVGVHDNFFDVSGDSILGIQIVSRARQAGLTLTPRDLMLHPTISELAEIAGVTGGDAMTIATNEASEALDARFPLARLGAEELSRLEATFEDEGIADIYPLSSLQAGMLYHTLVRPDDPSYVTQAAITVRGDLDESAFRTAWQQTIGRCAVLRTAFAVTNVEEMHQIVCRSVALPWKAEDWTGQSQEEQDRRARRLLAAEREQGFDLARPPLMRFRLVRLDEDRRLFVWTVHHALLDGWSGSILTAEVFRSYTAIEAGRVVELAPLPPFSDYIAWLEQQDHAAALAVWRNRFAEWEGPTPLPTRDSATVGEHRMERRAQTLSVEGTSALRSMAQTHRLTLNTVVQGAWALLLSRYSGRDDVTFGVTVSGRPPELAGVERMVGLLLNTLPMRVDLADRALIPWLRELQGRQIELQSFGFSPLHEIQRLVKVDGRGTGLFESIFVFENYPVSTVHETPRGELRLEAFDDYAETHYPLTVVVRPGEQLHLEFRYDASRFDVAMIEQMLRHLAVLLEAMPEQLDVRIQQLPILDAVERRHLIEDWNDTTRTSAGDRCVHEYVMEHATRMPSAVAVTAGAQQLSYGELDERSTRLARSLCALGVGTEDVVGLHLERGVDMVVGMLGILKAGAAYVPLDIGDPPERLRRTLEHANVPVIVTAGERALAFGDADLRVVRIDAPAQVVAADLSLLRARRTALDHLAYVIHTSGSSGRPKGVCVTHRSLSNLVGWHQRTYGIEASDRASQVASIGFDACVWEVWPYLAGGASVHVVDDATRQDPAKLWAWLVETGITMTFLPTPLAEVMLAAGIPAGQSLRAMLTGGDRLRHGTGPLPFRFVNHYGPTESTVVTTAWDVGDESPPPIGRPIANQRVYLLDQRMEPLPVGVPGELFVGGIGVARGYLNDPLVTAARFVPDPFGSEPGSRLYRTGDLARYRADGTLAFVGRLDHQIKVRGHRIEPGEIEAALLRTLQVRETVVVCREDECGHRSLVAYVVLADGRQPSKNMLREQLRQVLPEYMVPAAYVFLETLPRNANGKVDRSILPAPDGDHADEAAFVPPRTELETRLAEIWCDLLDREQVGLRDNFFDAGGDSILIIRMIALAREQGLELELPQVFEHPTIEALAAGLGGNATEAPVLQHAAEARIGRRARAGDEAIAVIAMNGRFPGARSVEALWRNLCDGVEGISVFSDEELRAAGISDAQLANPNYVPARGIIEDVDLFDAWFFGYNPREAELIDPQQRVFLECAWELLERAGYDPHRYDGLIGVYAGATTNTYVNNVRSHPELIARVGGVQSVLSTDKDYVATRVSYKLNLRGPAVNVQTACSTSLVAIHEACRSLSDYQCDMAIAGGIAIALPVKQGYTYLESGIGSPDGHCRTFDAAARGTVNSSGVALVMLKRLDQALADGDHIHAVIRGTAINNDGAAKVGYTAPSIEGQSAVIALAQAAAGIEPETIGFVEAHGTGTSLGDPVEVAALAKVFRERTTKTGFCAIGSIKSSIGHLNEAAGAAGFIKATMAVEHGLIPPSLHFETPNPEIDFEHSPFVVSTTCCPWSADGHPRRAAVSSFGLGGTNAHAILEEPPDRATGGADRAGNVFVLSAKTADALETATTNLAAHLHEARESVADVAFTLQVGRAEFEYRRAVIGQTRSEVLAALEGRAPDRTWEGRVEARRPSIVFMFPGQGGQYVDMARGLRESERVFRAALDDCLDHLDEPTRRELLAALFPDDAPSAEAAARLMATDLAQPALFLVEYALAEMWRSWGVEPEACIGHSIGEYVAACIAGAIELPDALRLVVARGRLMSQLPEGAMVAVPLSEAVVREHLVGYDDLSLAAVNAPELCVVSGAGDSIDAFVRSLARKGIEGHRLHTSHAFHSSHVDAMIPAFGRIATTVQFTAPRIPFISNVTGDWITEAEVTDPSYWGRQMREPVRFADGIARVLEDPACALLEVGPGRALGSLARTQVGRDEQRVIASSLRAPTARTDDDVHLAGQLARLWAGGVSIDWARLHEGTRRRRVILPTYPFQREHYWIEPGAPRPARRPVDEWLHAPGWRITRALVPVGRSTARASLVVPGGSALADAVVERLREQSLPVRTVGRDGTSVMADRDAWKRCFETMIRAGEVPEQILLILDRPSDEQDVFLTPLAVVQGLADAAVASPIRLDVVTFGACAVTGDEPLRPEHAIARGPCRVIPRELPQVSCRQIDLDPREFDSLEDRWIDALVGEVRGRAADPLVALREGRRYVEMIGRVEAPAPDGEPDVLRERGTYLITGGLGGIGLVLAQYLAETFQARLVLTSRRPLPPRERWSDYQREHGPDGSISRRIRGVERLEAAGAEVLVLPADVADLDRMRRVIYEATARFGAIHGVIHAAGVPGGGVVLLQDRQSAAATFAPKVDGTLVIGTLFADANIDFLVLCGSLASTIGVAGQVDYCAANAFQSAFARSFQARTGIFTVTIDWHRWREVGMAVDAARARGDEKPGLGISNREGVEIFRRVLAARLEPQVLLSHVDLGETAARDRPASTSNPEAEPSPAMHARPDIRTDYAEPGTDVERELVSIWQALLGIERIGVHDDFFDLGGHSLLATQALNRMSSAWVGAGISLQTIFDHPTIASLAALIEAAQDGTPAQGEDLRAQILAADPGMRMGLVRAHLEAQLGAMAGAADREGFDEGHIAEVLWILKRDLDLTVYANEIRSLDSLDALADFVRTEVERMDRIFTAPVQVSNPAPTLSSETSKPALPPGERRNAPAVFLLSAPRSGSTLLRLMLGGHPGLYCPPELGLLGHETINGWYERMTGQYAQETVVRALMGFFEMDDLERGRVLLGDLLAREVGVQEVFRMMQDHAAPRILVDKSPGYATRLDTLRTAEVFFEDARYIHLVRHPYAVVESLVRTRAAMQMKGGDHDPFGAAERTWSTSHGNIVAFTEAIDPARCMRVHYEHLVAAPESTMRSICAFLELPYDPAMLDPYGQGRNFAGFGDPDIWRHEGIDARLGEAWRRVRLPRFLSQATSERARSLGYELPDGGELAQFEPPGSLPDPALAERRDTAPLSFSQERIWFLDQMGGGAAYSLPTAFRVRGAIDLAILERSVNSIVFRHEALRTTFSNIGGVPHQVIAPVQQIPLVVCDLMAVPNEQREAVARDVLAREGRRPFDLEAGPLLRTMLVRVGEREHIFLLNMHHIVSDAWSQAIFRRELTEHYRAFLTGQVPDVRPLPIQYVDYAVAQQAWLETDAFERQRAYWHARLGDGVPVLELRTDHSRPPVQTYSGKVIGFSLPSELTKAIESLARRENLTLAMLLLAAFQALLSRYTGQHDIAVGSPIANRNRRDVEELIGFFVNTLVLRTDLSGDPTVVELLERTKRVALGAYENQDFPFERLVDELAPSRDPGRSPLVQVFFAVQNVPSAEMQLADLVVEPFRQDAEATRFDLEIYMARAPQGLGGRFWYNPDLFEESTIRRMLDHFQKLLQGFVSNPASRLSELSLLDDAERDQILVEWNDTSAPYPDDRCVHELFEAQVERTPDAIAVIFDDETLTYDQLNRRANRMAHTLRDMGVGVEASVGLCMERSLEMVVGILGILKAGGAYLPLDPALPERRLERMLDENGTQIVLVQDRTADVIQEGAWKTIRIDSDFNDAVDGRRGRNPRIGVEPAHIAYVLYTSGSTGRPKGVLGTHRGVVNRCAWMWDAHPFRRDEVCCQKTALGFVDSVWEIFGPLLQGMPLVVIPDGIVRDPQLFVKSLARNKITRIVLVPSLLRALLDRYDDLGSGLPCLRFWVSSGEALSVETCQRFRRSVPDATLLNLYGSSEVAADATAFDTRELQESATGAPIGRPIANTQAYVLDAVLAPVPVGVPGELCIGGVPLARGYLAQPARTAERFVPDPFAGRPGQRLYRTGDLARYRADGSLDFLGRVDHQVKLRGYRIELGEIETGLTALPGIDQAVVVLRGDQSNDQQLVAFVTRSGPPTPSAAPAELREALASHLPGYMVPSAFVVLDALPLTPNGKIDRRAVAALDATPDRASAAYVAPRSDLESRVAAVWRDVLTVDRVGVEDNFFDLGGHSLQLPQVQARLTDELGSDGAGGLSITDLFEYPTVAALARRLAGGDPPSVSEARERWTRRRRRTNDDAIAVIGMAGRFPGAPDIETFWRNLRHGVESVRTFTYEELRDAGIDESLLADPNYVRARAVLDDADRFDAWFFGYTPREAELIDPQQRVFLECAWEAVERAGYDPRRCESVIGVWAGIGMNTYLANIQSRPDLVATAGGFQTFISNDKDFLTTRVSYKLDLRGPSVNVQTACSTSLVAVHEACQALLEQRCDIALAGGVSVRAGQTRGYVSREGGILSPDGHCRAFDARARGTHFGNAVGIVVLKPLEQAIADGDQVHAIIRGTAVNNDGANKVGYTAPSVEGQAEAIGLAQAAAGIEADSVTYVEAHGTGTPMGDPIEVAALCEVFEAQTDRKGFCGIGSLKTNVGHLDAAAGVAGLIKTVLALEHRELPPSLNFDTPNPEIDFARSPFYVVNELRPWNREGGRPRRAGVSSFGIGGTNAHAILEEAPPLAASGPSRACQLLVLSAKSAAALETATAHLAARLVPDAETEAVTPLADVAYTLQIGRGEFEHRRAIFCNTMEEAVAALRGDRPDAAWTGHALAGERHVAFMFPGQGAQYVNMGLGLYESEPVFREAVDHCLDVLARDASLEIRSVLYPGDGASDEASERLTRTAVAQPALFTIQYALARLWQSWGVEPEACIGHSIGEFTAACVAEVLDVEDALRLVALRGRLMEQMPEGAMLAVPLGEQRTRRLIDGSDGLWLSAVNGPSLCVVSGRITSIDTLHQRLAAEGVECRRLHTSHAFHSDLMEEAIPPFVDAVRSVRMSAPRIPYVSNVTGDWIGPTELEDPEYWGQHIREPVHFTAGLETLLASSGRLLLEVGPGGALGSLVRQHPSCGRDRVVVSSMRHGKEQTSDVAFLTKAIGRLWVGGARVDWSKYHGDERRRRVLLPTYPFSRDRFWIEPRRDGERGGLVKRREIARWFYVPVWKSARLLDAAGDVAERERTWLIFESRLDLVRGLVKRLSGAGTVLRVVPGEGFRALEPSCFTIDPREPGDYRRLIDALAASGQRPSHVVHGWSLSGSEAREEIIANGLESVLFLVQALAAQDTPTDLTILTRRACRVTGGELLCPAVAAVLGLARVIPQEHPLIRCRTIDVEDADDRTLQRLVDELRAGTVATTVAYRAGCRWVQSYDGLETDDRPPPVRDDGVYLITGGLGRVGLEMAEALAGAARVKLVLTGRSAFPVPDTWDRWLERHDDGDRAARIISRLHAMESRGTELMIVQADVEDAVAMRDLLVRIDDRFGMLHGVIHAAGVVSGPSMDSIVALTHDTCETQLRPKFDGLHVLDDLLAGRPLDFRMVTSSLSAVLGGLGMAAYAAANASLDAFAGRSLLGDEPWMSVDWDAWQFENASPPAAAATSALGIAHLAMRPDEGATAFLRLLGVRGVPQVVVSTGDLNARLDQWVRGRPEGKDTSCVEEPGLDLHARPQLSTDYVEPRTATERDLAAVWRTLLGIEQIGVHDGFFDLGGHSLLATQLLNRLSRTYPTARLSLRSLFDHPTIAALAELVDASGPETGDAGTLTLREKILAAPCEEREDVLREYLVTQLAETLDVAANRLQDDTDLTDFGSESLIANLMWVLKRDLQLTVFAHELREHLSVGALVCFLLTELELVARLACERSGDREPIVIEAPAPNGQSPPNVPCESRNGEVIFVLSAPRSGSTLVRLMLGGHSKLCAPPELSLLPYRGMQQWTESRLRFFAQDTIAHTFAAFLNMSDIEAARALLDALTRRDAPIEEVYRLIQAQSGERTLVDKSPGYSMRPETLERAEVLFDRPRYVHLVRHPYAVIESLVRNRMIMLDEAGRADPYGHAERRWAISNGNVEAFLAGVDSDRWIRLRYEDVVSDPGTHMGALCEFLALDFESSMLDPYGKGRLFAGFGDPDILSHRVIEPRLGEVWRTIHLPRRLSDYARALAESFAYELPNEEAAGGSAAAPVSASVNVDELTTSEVDELLDALLREQEGPRDA